MLTGILKNGPEQSVHASARYNLIASKLPLNWPTGLLNLIGGIQIFFTSGEGIFSLDCLLQVRSLQSL